MLDAEREASEASEASEAEAARIEAEGQQLVAAWRLNALTGQLAE